MTTIRANISTSLDGFVCGPNDSRENPLGDGGERLHEWIYDLASWREVHGLEGGETNQDDEVFAESIENVGAVVMGRRMFDNGEGPWDADEPFEGHWSEDPPFGVPVFVLTHHEREPLELGETTFTFVTEGVEAAVERATDAAAERTTDTAERTTNAAGDGDVSIAGGSSVIQQSLEVGLFEPSNHDGIELESTRVLESPAVTHLRFAVGSPNA